MSDNRAYLDVDGDCAYALLGLNIQEGEAEFVKIERDTYDGRRHAATQALRRLEERLGRRLAYELGPGVTA